VCDRIAVMSRGRLQDVRPADQWTEKQIMASAIEASITSNDISHSD
jgi:ABC-type sugar transport system ATPase subunit